MEEQVPLSTTMRQYSPIMKILLSIGVVGLIFDASEGTNMSYIVSWLEHLV